MPNLYRRALTIKVLLPVAGALVSIGIPILFSLVTNPASAVTERRIGLLVFVAPLGYALGSGAYILYRSWALRRHVRRGAAACLGCGYALRMRARAGQCPECGRHYDRPATFAAWRELLGGRP